MTVKHVIVDGSNIATEGRDTPSLAQLDEAVRAFVDEYHPEIVTVVVDATFPNRIDPSERKTYEEAVANNELITPPAGAIGRGDGFVLQIADKAGATILSNDSFQEFHGKYPWLFERGRLIGGKPVPHVGWVFMERAPVRGPTSRRAVSEARKEAKAAAAAAAGAAGGEPSGSGAGAGSGSKSGSGRKAASRTSAGKKAREGAEAAPAAAASGAASETAAASGAAATPEAGPTDEDAALAAFVAAHPVGTQVEATVERFSSHGAYASVDGTQGYLPLRYLADPPPRSAKEVLTAGESRTFVVVAIDYDRRSVDLGIPGVPGVPEAEAPEPAPAPARRRSRKKKAAEPALPAPPAEEVAPAEPAEARAEAEAPAELEGEPKPARKRSRRKAAEPEPEPQAEPERAVRKRASRKKAAEPVAADAETSPELAAAELEGEPKPARKRASRNKAAEPVVADVDVGPAPEAEGQPRKRASRKRAAEPVAADAEPSPELAAEEPQAARKRASRKKAASPVVDADPMPDGAEAGGPAPAGEPPAGTTVTPEPAAAAGAVPAPTYNGAESGSAEG